VAHYERLEFLGDRVLNLLTAEHLLERETEAREGALSPMLASLVNRTACARVARRLGLGPALRLSPGESKSGGREKDNILADACEAVMAAIYIDGGLTAARAFFQHAWAEEFGLLGRPEPKTALQEWAMARGLPLPAYRIVERTGPDHAPVFTVRVEVDGFPAIEARGRARQEAEKTAATAFLQKQGAPS
jgi:ribonuclease-3